MSKPRGRPKQYDDRQAMYVRVPVELHERLLAEGERRDVPANQLICWAVERVLPLWEAQNVDEFERVEP